MAGLPRDFVVGDVEESSQATLVFSGKFGGREEVGMKNASPDISCIQQEGWIVEDHASACDTSRVWFTLNAVEQLASEGVGPLEWY